MPTVRHAHHGGYTAAEKEAAKKFAEAHPLWQVVRQELDRKYVPGTDPVEQWNVYFVTRSGSEAYVTIPRDVYSADMAAAMIEPQARIMEEVAALHAKP